MPGAGERQDGRIRFDDAVEMVNTHLPSWAESAGDLPPRLVEAVNHSLLSGGKRLRPALVLLAYQAAGGDHAQRSAMPSAIAVEMIHCFSLIHDDLPAMDDDDLRRGKPTCHKQFDEAIAILAGDLLATWPYRLLAGDTHLTAEVRTRLCAELAEATSAMIAGQVLDTVGVLSTGSDLLAQVQRIHELKTAALIRGACRMGAIAAGANDDTLNSISRFGEVIGLMFQIVDDVLDVTQSTEALGKRASKDAEAGKLTYPAAIGIDASRTRVADLAVEAESALRHLDEDATRTQPLRDLITRLAERTR